MNIINVDGANEKKGFVGFVMSYGEEDDCKRY